MLETPISAKPSEVPQIREWSERLDAARSHARYMLDDPEGGTRLALPEPLFRVLAAAAHQLARGHSVALVHYEKEWTTQQAADLLQVSRPYLIRLLDAGQMSYRRVGTHRRIRIGDILRYQEIRDERRRADIKELIRVSDTLGLYDEDGAEATGASES